AVALDGGFGSGGTAGTRMGDAPRTTRSSAATTPSRPTPTPTRMSPTPDPSTSPTPNAHLSGSTLSSSPNTVFGTIPRSWKPPAPGGSLSDPTDTDGQSVAQLLIDGLQQLGPGSGSGFSGSSMAGVNANATLTWTTQHGSVRISASVSNGALDG